MFLNSSQTRTIFNLNGRWSFALDPDDRGEQDAAFRTASEQSIQIPGSWEEQGYGSTPESRLLFGWTKEHEYEGAAWYVRDLIIPPESVDQTITLVLKGVRWRSRVWLDDIYVGERESLSVPHAFDLTGLAQPGQTHRIAIRIDNRMLYSLQESHINSIQTATHWGGITGGAELVVTPKTAIVQITCAPKVGARRFDFAVMVSGETEGLVLEAAVSNPETGETFTARTTVSGGSAVVSVELGANARLWWDDNPFLYTAAFRLLRDDELLDSAEKHVGLREFTVSGRQMLLNGVPIFLRGYVDCCIFPLTGYPSWDVEHYRRQFRVARSYGFNHVRLHSWTAPEPFWQAADELGMLVQTELPNWTHHYGHSEVAPPADLHHFLIRELEQIVDALQLHPSWVMFSNGNELIYDSDGHPGLFELAARGKELDPTRLFTDQTGFGQLPTPGRDVDYYIQSCNWHPPKRLYDAASPNTTEDFSAVTAYADRPVIGHEHGQFTMYVRPSEAEKYTGVIRPTWLESIEQTFAAKAMGSRVDGYIQASGTHIVRTYKENIERARRTADLSGIHLLDIRDFPGQGHATTGILDMFWDSKGLVEPDVFRQCNDTVVLLMRAVTPTFYNNGSLRAQFDVSNFSRKPIEGALDWELVSDDYRFTGQLTVPVAPNGEITTLASLDFPLPDDRAARAWVLSVQFGGYGNSWHVWSFPYPALRDDDPPIISRIASLRNALPRAEYRDDFNGTGMNMHGDQRLSLNYKLAISDRLTMRLMQYLHDGGDVWLMPPANWLFDSVKTRYIPPFWSYLHFPDNVSSVMGMQIHAHPAFGRFPHDGMSDWHWYGLVNDTPAICLDSVPFIEPILEVIDNFNRAKRLAYAFEARVGKGRLFVSTMRLYDAAAAGRPEGRFLLNEILSYLLGDAFAPAAALSVGQVLGLFRLTNGLTFSME